MSVTQISALDAFELLSTDQNSVLIDVRTNEEFRFVGVANPSSFGDRMILLPWQIWPEMEENPDFDQELEDALEKIFAQSKNQAKLIFMCRTGARSNAAAYHAVNLGYENCYNLSNGFEGDINDDEQRGKTNGWKANNLPWRQK